MGSFRYIIKILFTAVVLIGFSPAWTYADTSPCAPTNPITLPADVDPQLRVFSSHEFDEYSPKGFLTQHFKNNTNIVETVTLRWDYFDDDCNSANATVYNAMLFYGFPEGVTDWSIRFASSSHFDVWDDGSETIIASRDIVEQSPYVSVGFTASINRPWGNHVLIGRALKIWEGGQPPTHEGTLVKDPQCPSIYTQGAGVFENDAMFDGSYEHAEYVDGLLRVHLRFATRFAVQVYMWVRGVSVGADCARAENVLNLPLVYGFPEDVGRYFSFRMTSPTHWVMWDDEKDEQMQCGDECQGDIDPDAQYVYWNVYRPTNYNPFILDTTPYAPTEAVGVPTIANLKQFREFGVDAIEPGADFVGNAVVLKADVTSARSVRMTLEVELKKTEEAFDGTDIRATSSDVVAGDSTTLTVTIDDLLPFSEQYVADMQQGYHWRARVVNAGGNASEWEEFEDDNGTDFIAKLTIGYGASLLAREVVTYPYVLGARGWDFVDDEYVEASRISSGYKITASNILSGLDCSGLVEWAYNRYFSPTTNFLDSYVPRATADDQYRLRIPITENELRPGDLLFFDWGALIPGTNRYDGVKDGTIDHVAMYARSDPTHNMIHAQDDKAGIVAVNSYTNWTMLDAFVGFGRPKFNKVAILARTHSPVHLSVTDPEGNIVSDMKVEVTPEEIIRSDGDLLFATVDYDADGYPEDVAYSYTLKPGTYKVDVAPYENVPLTKAYSLEFTAGSTTVQLAKDKPLSEIPSGGYDVIVDENHNVTVVTDTTPPEARITFDKAAKKILVTGTDDTSTTTVVTTATSSLITDEAGNAVSLALSNQMTKPSSASLTIPAISYSTGTTTSAATTLRYFWAVDKKGRYNMLISGVRTPTERWISIYIPFINKTYLIKANKSDDVADLSAQAAFLLLRKKVKTYSGMVLPVITTDQGKIIVRYE